MQVPSLHAPYLLMAALFGLIQAVELLVPVGAVVGYVGPGILVAAGVTHFMWLHRVFKDGEACLGPALPMTAVRVLVFAGLTVVVAPVWASFTFMVLLRATVNGYVERGSEVPAHLDRVAREASGLVVTAAVLVLVEFVVYFQLNEAGVLSDEIETLPPVGEIIGAPATIGFALFKLVCAVYWTWFVARAVPALYAAFGDALRAGTQRNDDGSI